MLQHSTFYEQFLTIVLIYAFLWKNEQIASEVTVEDSLLAWNNIKYTLQWE